MDISKIVSDMIDVAKTILPLVSDSGQDIVELGEKIVKMIDTVTDEITDSAEIEKLIEQRDQLEDAVNANVDRTVKRLRGQD